MRRVVVKQCRPSRPPVKQRINLSVGPLLAVGIGGAGTSLDIVNPDASGAGAPQATTMTVAMIVAPIALRDLRRFIPGPLHLPGTPE
jgi:hypothetical protein